MKGPWAGKCCRPMICSGERWPNTFEESKMRGGARAFRAGRFRGEYCEAARSELNRCRAQAEVSRVPSDFLSAKDVFRLPNSEADKVVHVMKHGRCDKNQTVEAVENAAVPGNEFCRVLEAKITLDRGKH